MRRKRQGGWPRMETRRDIRGWIDLVEEPTAVGFVKNARESPGLVFKRLDVHDLDEQDVSRLGRLDLKGPRQVVDLGQVDVAHVVGAVVVADLAAGPGRRQ